MPLDNILLNNLTLELSQNLSGLFIDKISITVGGEIIFYIKQKELVVSLPLGFITITNKKPETAPNTPSNFCMLLRKHLQGGKIELIEKIKNDRIVKLAVLKRDELFEMQQYIVYIELFGSKNNLILTKNNKIIDAFFRSDLQTATKIIAPGAVYTPQNLDTLTLCPLIKRELEFRNITLQELLKTQAPTLLKDNNNNYKDFSFTNILQYGNLYKNETFTSYIELINTFYLGLLEARRQNSLFGELKKVIKNAIIRTEKKLLIRKNDLKNAENSENLRIYGEIIKANIYKINKGQSLLIANNFYDNNKEIKINLNPAKSPQENAAKYFKDYKKSCNAAKTLKDLILQCQEELSYLYSVNEELLRAKTYLDMELIKRELIESKIIKKAKQKTKNAAIKIKEEEFEGFKILIGRNNLENDQITLKKAEKQDLWFHTKNIPGSHVVIKTGGKEVPNSVIIYAATLAAKNSAAKQSSGVAVDYTKIKNVKKPAGAKPGMVIYKTNKTVFVTPN